MPDSSLIVGSTHRHHTITLSRTLKHTHGEQPAFIPNGVQFNVAPGWTSASYSTDILTPPFRFDEVLVSANLSNMDGASAVVEVQVCDGAGQWTPFLRIASVGDNLPQQRAITVSAPASIDIDYLRSATPCTKARVNVWFQWKETQDGPSQPMIEQITTTFTASAHDPHGLLPIALATSTTSRGWPVGRLPVPFKSQRTSDPSLSGRLCSPTSVAMVLAYYGFDRSVEDVSAIVHDRANDIYGNWPLNIQGAFTLGAPARLARFAMWEEVEALISAGQPIIMSIAVEKGELPQAPYESTDGHLLVLCGFDESGDLLVNDPACGTPQEGMRTYPRATMTRIWLQRCKGTAYVLQRHPPQPRPAGQP